MVTWLNSQWKLPTPTAQFITEINKLTELQNLIEEWAQKGQVDVTDWGANEVMTILSGRPDFREKFVALLELRTGQTVQ